MQDIKSLLISRPDMSFTATSQQPVEQLVIDFKFTLIVWPLVLECSYLPITDQRQQSIRWVADSYNETKDHLNIKRNSAHVSVSTDPKLPGVQTSNWHD